MLKTQYFLTQKLTASILFSKHPGKDFLKFLTLQFILLVVALDWSRKNRFSVLFVIAQITNVSRSGHGTSVPFSGQTGDVVVGRLTEEMKADRSFYMNGNRHWCRFLKIGNGIRGESRSFGFPFFLLIVAFEIKYVTIQRHPHTLPIDELLEDLCTAHNEPDRNSDVPTFANDHCNIIF